MKPGSTWLVGQDSRALQQWGDASKMSTTAKGCRKQTWVCLAPFGKGGNGHQTSARPIAKPGGKLDAHRKGTSSRKVVAGHKKVADLNLNKFEYSNSWIMAKRKEGTGTLKLKS